jgi:hypothetical protein
MHMNDIYRDHFSQGNDQVLRGHEALGFAEEDEKEPLNIDEFLRVQTEAKEARATGPERLTSESATWFKEEIVVEGFEQGLVGKLEAWRSQRTA